ncbi:Hypothetical predicted protein [Lecanosticta acicola]|uniref:Carboxylesterase type B domain-containing protein n=1 Tax=Lecanosticta acicola TaxID=111012 RepID=A0AAI8Z621_9PEZI|nr:Hypothetical predicted protein [Lecanosticta acicola]
MRVLNILSSLVSGVAAVSPLVKLDYASYQGTALPNNVSQWLGIRYASPPTGDLRFAAPVDPKNQTGIQQANKHGPICIGTNQGPPTASMNEDCLFLDVYAPSNATAASKLPVYFFIQGGGFATNGNPNYNGSGLINASEYDMIVVTHNYRVGPWGFLASGEVQRGGSANNGLRDQRKAMQWVKQYISHFGGDPDHVTMGGDSAGGQSVCMQLTAYGGRDDGLFQGAAAESQSFPPLRTVAESQYNYNGLVIRAGCASASDTLACLRGLNATALQAVNVITPFPGAQGNPLYPYGPTLDYDFVSDYTFRAYAQGKFVKVPAIYGDDTNEGTIFAPKNTSTIAQSNTFLQNNFPDLTLAQIKRFNELYPVEGTPSFPDSGRYWRQASNAYGELRYICPGIYLSQVSANQSVPNWNYRWNVIDPTANASGYGVSHTVETNALWGPNVTHGAAPTSYYPGQLNHPIVSVVQGYWTSFIRTFDPNTYRKAGTPTWEVFDTKNFNRRLMYQTNHTLMESIDPGQLLRCEYLWSLALELKQ